MGAYLKDGSAYDAAVQSLGAHPGDAELDQAARRGDGQFDLLPGIGPPGGHGSSRIHDKHIVTPLQGFRDFFAQVSGTDGEVAVICVGSNAAREGEFFASMDEVTTEKPLDKGGERGMQFQRAAAVHRGAVGSRLSAFPRNRPGSL